MELETKTLHKGNKIDGACIPFLASWESGFHFAYQLSPAILPPEYISQLICLLIMLVLRLIYLQERLREMTNP